MAVQLARRDLLRGRLKSSPVSARPPYAIAENNFIEKCKQCPDCVSACEAGVIRIDGDGYPVMSFIHGECDFCGECLAACTTGALDADRARAWNVVAEVDASCLSLNAVTCRSCGDNCEQEAIVFRLMTMGRSLPVIDEKLCNGCGACVHVCPSHSVRMNRSENGGGLKRPWEEVDAA
jgi:ferredoxin-type protein NapF